MLSYPLLIFLPLNLLNSLALSVKLATVLTVFKVKFRFLHSVLEVLCNLALYGFYIRISCNSRTHTPRSQQTFQVICSSLDLSASLSHSPTLLTRLLPFRLASRDTPCKKPPLTPHVCSQLCSQRHLSLSSFQLYMLSCLSARPTRLGFSKEETMSLLLF